MRDIELYQHLLGLEEPWSVSNVRLDVATQSVDVWAEHPKGQKWPCPECGQEVTLHDHAAERVWRHLDSCQYQTFLHARPPRVKCPKHGVRQVRLPWAEPHGRFTLLFERFAIDVLLHTNIQGARRILQISWDEAWHLMNRAVQRGLARKQQRVIPRIGVDEKSAGKGQKNYVTIISDVDSGKVEDVVEGNNSASLEFYFQGLSREQLSGVEAVSIDMSTAYISAVQKTWEDGSEKIVFDRFHIMKCLGKAVDKVRKQEHKVLSSLGNSLLSGTKYFWLYARKNIPGKYWDQLWLLKNSDLKTARAWAIRENISHLWDYKTVTWAEKLWKKWYFWATHSRLEPIKKAANTLKRHHYGIMNYFKHRITNAGAESINSRIQSLWNAACGFRNKARLRIVILFHLGGLNLHPSTH